MTKLHSTTVFIFALILLFGLAGPLSVMAGKLDDLQIGQNAFNRGDYTHSLSIWQTLATQGHAEAQLFVGLSYSNGWGIKKSRPLAAVWFKKAANNGNTAGQFLLGLNYLSGNNNVDKAEGLWWLKKAANNGDVSAQGFLNKAIKQQWFNDLMPRAPIHSNRIRPAAYLQSQSRDASIPTSASSLSGNPDNTLAITRSPKLY